MNNETAIEYIETLLRHFKDQLTEWEYHFVLDLEANLKGLRPEGESLSPRQTAVLDRLMERCARERS